MSGRGGWAGVASGALLALAPLATGAQTRLVEPAATTLAPSFDAWWFPEAIATDGLAVTAVTQVTAPLATSLSPVRNWRVDASAAYSRGEVRILDPGTGEDATVVVDGLTDARVRAVGRLLQERVWLTVGVNLPIGRVGLSGEEASAARVLGAPALRMSTPVLGSGTGVTAGAVYASTLGRWAVALGASYELRSTYTPLEADLAVGDGVTADLDPAETVHLTLGLERIAGRGRVSFLLFGDRYGTDHVTIRPAEGGPETRTEYRLGPTFGAVVEYRLATARVRELRLSAGGRYRSEFSNANGQEVAGSSGTVMEGAVAATIGRGGGIGVVLRAEALVDSGLDVDPTLATAAMTSGGLTVGIALPVGGVTVQPFLRGSLGRLDLGSGTTTARGVGAGLTVRSGG